VVEIIVGVIGFAAGLAADFASLRRWTYVKPFAWLAASLLLGYAHVSVALSPEKLALPGWTPWVGWPCLLLGAALMVYSLYLELPAAQTYVRDTDAQAVVQAGTYALTRHPGALWYALLLIGLVLASRSRLALWAAPVWFAMELLWVWIEDRFIFERVIAGYGEYKKTTPMLIPSRASLARCWQTLPLRRSFTARRKTAKR